MLVFPLLSVIIINWNAQKYLIDCVDSVLSSDYPALQIILVDNASSDGGIEKLKSHLGEQFSQIELIVNQANFGAAVALNIGSREAKGKYLAFIASDTRVDKQCFRELVKHLEADETIGGAESKLLLLEKPEQFDHAGEYLSQFGLLLQRHAGNEIDKGQFDYLSEIFSAKGTALTVRREAFEQIGGFDPDYFMFLEETDLCWRIWLSGHRIIFVPTAKIYHASGVSIRAHQQRVYLARYYGSRNYITTLFKNLGTKNLIRILPLHILMWFLLALFFMVKLRLKDGFYILKGILYNFLNFIQILKKRNKIQKNRVVSDRDLMPRIMRRVGIPYLLERVAMW